jgi:hypothetical protein
VQHAGQLARAPAAMVRVPGVADPAEKESAQRKHVGQRQDRRKGEGHGGPCWEWGACRSGLILVAGLGQEVQLRDAGLAWNRQL